MGVALTRPDGGTSAPASPTAGPTRRALLIAVASGVLVGCSPSERSRRTGTDTTAAQIARRDDTLRARAAADERELVEVCGATARRHPSLASLLAVLLAHHIAHLDGLTAPPQASPTAGPSAPTSSAAGESPRPGGSGSSPAAASRTGTVPATPAAAVQALARHEQTVADARRADCELSSPVLAPLLGSVGAAAAVHAALLHEDSQ